MRSCAVGFAPLVARRACTVAWQLSGASFPKQRCLLRSLDERGTRLTRPKPDKLTLRKVKVASSAEETVDNVNTAESCCGHTSHSHSRTTKLHSLLSSVISSIPLINYFKRLHHSRRGASIAVLALFIFSFSDQFSKKWVESVAMAVVLCVSGVPMFTNALLRLSLFDINAAVLMSLSALGSIYLGMPGEGLLLLILCQVAHLLEEKFTNRSKASLRALLDSVPDKAVVVAVDPETMEPQMDSAEEQKASDIPVGTFVVVKPGEQVPLDGLVVSGTASVTVEYISGESLPVLVHPGSKVAAGSVNADGLLVLKTIATFENSTPTKIAQLAVQAQASKPDVQRWIDGITSNWSKCALLGASAVAAVAVALGVPFFGARGALYRSLCIVTAAAPCALILSPLAYVCALANASQRSILIKSAATLDVLRGCKHVALDKTGTLTEGKLVCTNIVDGEDVSKNGDSPLPKENIIGTPRKHLALCHAVELSKRSTHPIAYAVLEAGRQHLRPEDGNCRMTDFELVPGYGVRGTIQPRVDCQDPVVANFGSVEFIQGELESTKGQNALNQAMQSVHDMYGDSVSVLTTRYLNGKNAEWSAFCFRDELQSLSKAAVRTLQSGSWMSGKNDRRLEKRVSIVTGDNEASAQAVGQVLDINDISANFKPEDKLRFIQHTQESLRAEHGIDSGMVMVGDGINDAPALAQADVGISISETATNLSATASDIVLLNGQGIANLPFLFVLSDRVHRVVRQNLCLALAAMLVVCIPALKGCLPLWLIMIVHEGSTVLTAANSCRLLFLKSQKLEK